MEEKSLSPETRYRNAAASVVRRLRTDAGWSLREFGEQVGVAHTSLYAVERGDTTPTIDTLARIGESRGIPLAALLAMIVEAIDPDPAVEQGSLSRLLSAATGLSSVQIDELLGFIDYVIYRDGPR